MQRQTELVLLAGGVEYSETHQTHVGRLISGRARNAPALPFPEGDAETADGVRGALGKAHGTPVPGRPDSAGQAASTPAEPTPAAPSVPPGGPGPGRPRRCRCRGRRTQGEEGAFRLRGVGDDVDGGDGRVGGAGERLPPDVLEGADQQGPGERGGQVRAAARRPGAHEVDVAAGERVGDVHQDLSAQPGAPGAELLHRSLDAEHGGDHDGRRRYDLLVAAGEHSRRCRHPAGGRCAQAYLVSGAGEHRRECHGDAARAQDADRRLLRLPAHDVRFRTRLTLCPPKPKELASAASQLPCRLQPLTTSRWICGSRVSRLRVAGTTP